jgi:hypothetical protein
MLADDADPVETFVERGRLKLGGQFEHGFLRDDSLPLRVAKHANIEWHVEKQRFDLTTETLANPDIRVALFRGEIGGVNVSEGAPCGYPLAQEVAKGLEDSMVDGLIGLVVGQKTPNSIGGESRDAEAFQVSGFSRSWQADQDYDAHDHS